MSSVNMHFKPGKPTEITVTGVPGSDCRTASKPYLEALNGKTISDTPTSEASLPPVSLAAHQTVGQNPQ